MKKLILFSLLLSISPALLGNISYASTTRVNEEDTIDRSNFGFNEPRRFSIEMINCSSIVTFRSPNPELKIMDAEGRKIPDFRAVPIDISNPSTLMLVPDLKEEDNLLNKAYSPYFQDNPKGLSYTQSSHPLVSWVPKYENSEEKLHSFKVEALIDGQNYEEEFDFQDLIKKHLVIKKEKDGEISIYMTDYMTEN